MNKWPVQDAKNQLSQVIELARSQGPQTITRHGRPMAVIVAFDEFQKMRPTIKETPIEFFSRLRGLKLELKRRKDLPRKISL
jgi:prevent-host-death family protein